MKGTFTGSDPRRRAAAVLARVDAGGAHAARLLADAAPATRELVLGVLRWQRVLDHLLAPHSRRPLAALDPIVRALLRAGLYEAARMDTPAEVAVSAAVDAAGLLAPRAGGLINAVLRRAAAAPWPDAGDEALPLGLRFSHPDWLVGRWLAAFGEEVTRRVLAADQAPAPLALLAAASDLAGMRAAGCRLDPHPHVAGVAVVRDGAAAAIAAVRRGRAYAMDPHAVAVARLLPECAGRVVELAAAPGGKSLVLACERGGRHLALDRHLGRVAMMRANLAAAPSPPLLAAADGAATPLAPGRCAAVLLDAPCSGTGTLRRHPEIRWRLRAADLAALAAAQRRLAAAAADLLAPGGWLLYATCSLEPEENAGALAGLGLEPQPAAAGLPAGVARVELTDGGAVILPDGQGDGFTVHLLRRRT